MSAPGDKWYDNLEEKTVINGKTYSFYCDHACIHCFMCQESAPDSFKTSEDEDHNIVYNQPKTAEELEKCLQAMEECPVEAIGCDGHMSTDKKYKRE
jgi:ferredoxin|tara:strand:+ start:952 stop:1242 length:291 start_codon:yes stop_codon:yes gene_type:complete